MNASRRGGFIGPNKGETGGKARITSGESAAATKLGNVISPCRLEAESPSHASQARNRHSSFQLSGKVRVMGRKSNLILLD